MDGQYFHLKVQDRLEELYGLQGGSLQFGWDPMHKSGLVDTHLMKEARYKWIEDDARALGFESLSCLSSCAFRYLSLYISL